MPANRTHQYARETAASTLLSGVHDRERREERDIDKVDLQRARRYGMKEDGKKGREKYTYGGVVFIYDPRRNVAITSWKIGEASKRSGTNVTTPIMLEKHKFESKEQKKEMKYQHKRLTLLLNEEEGKSQWTSHSVLVIDMSGSMRADDVNGARCRSDGVWMSLARDYVEDLLTKGLRGPNDLISIVAMKEEAEVIIKCEPTSWTLYNKLIELRECRKLKPSSHGFYLPAIAKAEELLTYNTSASCALSLLFFSDGKPSDPKPDHPVIVSNMGKLASKFGRRLSVSCIGMAEKSADFSTLEDMVEEAKQYGSIASFGKPSLDADSLSHIISGLASSLTTSRTEMTELRTGELRQVRMDIVREKLHTLDSEGTWKNYAVDDESRYVWNFWAWTFNGRRTGGFTKIVSRRCMHCYSEDELHSCADCKAAFLCRGCFREGNTFVDHKASNYGFESECDSLLKRIAMGSLLHKEEEQIPSFCIAVKDQAFGEGAERIVRKVRFLDPANGDYIGPIMVAKESRFAGEYHTQMAYHKNFMRTQDIAACFGRRFNDALDEAEKYFNAASQAFIRGLPRIVFIEPMVVELIDNESEKNILIERYLVGDYKKFNSNMGFVEDEVKKLVEQMNNLGVGVTSEPQQGIDLGIIEEGSEEEEETDDEDEDEGGEELFDSKEVEPGEGDYGDLQDAYFPQAFSHFSYERSRGNFMVVDLQGVFSVKDDGSKVYELTDPVIHQHDRLRRRSRRHDHNRGSKVGKKWNFGRTDRGINGMKAFFETHKCTDACRLLGLSEVDAEDV
mmetsp:Transcript_14747/g.22175  ORF Transcript_14747/g.22175 Transcript_14747/m.22175 type:complete len:790 (+) Transcript_14747:89-2458(+)